MKQLSIRDLLRREIIFVGGNWIEDPDAPEDSLFKGHRYVGKILCVNCSDLFYWGTADGIPLPDDCSEIEKAIEDCSGDIETGFLLWCARTRQMRPQKPYYEYFPKETWELFDACGPSGS